MTNQSNKDSCAVRSVGLRPNSRFPILGRFLSEPLDWSLASAFGCLAVDPSRRTARVSFSPAKGLACLRPLWSCRMRRPRSIHHPICSSGTELETAKPITTLECRICLEVLYISQSHLEFKKFCSQPIPSAKQSNQTISSTVHSSSAETLSPWRSTPSTRRTYVFTTTKQLN